MSTAVRCLQFVGNDVKGQQVAAGYRAIAPTTPF